MTNMDIATFYLAHLALVLCLVLLYATMRKGQRSHIQTTFYVIIGVMLVWNIGTLLEIYSRLSSDSGESNMLFVNICYFGICFAPIAILLLGKAISQSYLTLRLRYAALLIVPCVSMIVVITNPLHGLFFEHFSVYSSNAVYGPYFIFHSIYSYGCILAGILYMVSFSMKNSGIFSLQSFFVLLGVLVPLTANVLFSFNIIDLPFSINASMFTIALLCFAIAFYKYDFLKVAPIAVHSVVNLISDGYLVADNRWNIVASNKAMLRILPDEEAFPQNSSLERLINKYCDECTYASFLKLQAQAVAEKRTVATEYASRNNRWFTVEITPIFRRHELIGTIILLKDITQAKRDLETIRETQAIMVERERLVFLGQLIGGIAHNLKTPILSISGAIEGLSDLTKEYHESVPDPSVTEEDHREIAREMFVWLDKIKDHIAYISDVISTVKGQAVQFNRSEIVTFTLDEFLKRVDLLMKNELKKAGCTLRTFIEVDTLSEIAGDISTLVQIFDNLILNAIYSYEGKPGFIDLAVNGDEDKFVFSVTDYGAGIAPAVQARLFKEMVTTKGKNGTGLGLYLSNSTIKGHFNGQLTFTSELGRGSAFTITIPRHQPPPDAEAS
ncbi:MAG: ATP-binding protein [Clostridiales bacterium]|nr:ATP-binding protein [Clostridiales bacterium]